MNDLQFQIEQNEKQYSAGISCREQGLDCPKDATQAFQAGYGKAYDKEQMDDHKSLEAAWT